MNECVGMSGEPSKMGADRKLGGCEFLAELPRHLRCVRRMRGMELGTALPCITLPRACVIHMLELVALLAYKSTLNHDSVSVEFVHVNT